MERVGQHDEWWHWRWLELVFSASQGDLSNRSAAVSPCVRFFLLRETCRGKYVDTPGNRQLLKTSCIRKTPGMNRQADDSNNGMWNTSAWFIAFPALKKISPASTGLRSSQFLSPHPSRIKGPWVIPAVNTLIELILLIKKSRIRHSCSGNRRAGRALQWWNAVGSIWSNLMTYIAL